MPSLGEYSEVAICNMALAAVGRGAQITALDEDSQAARVCRLRYPYARDAVLRAFDWNFATRRAALARDAGLATAVGDCAYALPADCLLVRDVAGGATSPWMVEGRFIVTPQPPPLHVVYTARITDPGLFDALFTDALAARLAADIAMQVSDSPSRAQLLWQSYQSRMLEARQRDSVEGSAQVLPRGSWLDGRFEAGFVAGASGGDTP